MSKKSLTLGGMTFNRLSDAKDYVKGVLNSVHPEYCEEIDVPKDVYPVIKDMLGRHPRIHSKIKDFPNSLKNIVIRRSLYGRNEFCYVLSDGFIKTFSYLKCLGSESINHRADVTQVFRHLIRPQTRAFKDAFLQNKKRGICSISKLPFPSDDLVVDHFEPFSKLVQAFFKEYKLKYDDIEITYNDTEEEKEKVLKDDALAAKFVEYHKQHAVLCLIHRNLNKKLRDKKKEGPEFDAIVDEFKKNMLQGTLFDN